MSSKSPWKSISHGYLDFISPPKLVLGKERDYDFSKASNGIILFMDQFPKLYQFSIFFMMSRFILMAVQLFEGSSFSKPP